MERSIKRILLCCIMIMALFFTGMFCVNAAEKMPTTEKPKHCIKFSNNATSTTNSRICSGEARFKMSGFTGTAANSGYAYCYDMKVKGPAGGKKATSVKTIDKGKALCVLENGMSSGFSSNRQYLITQYALWRVQGNAKSKLSGRNSSTVNASNSLYNKCKSATSFTKKPSISISSISVPEKANSSGKYVITVKVSKSHLSKYTVAVSGVSGAKPSSSTQTGTSFTITVPETSVTAEKTMKVKVSGTGTQKYAKVYNFGSPKTTQPLIILMKKNLSVSDTESRTIKPTYYAASVKKVDENGKVVTAQATFAIYKGKTCTGTALKTVKTSAGVAKFTNLLKGDYRIKETVAPSGYQINSGCHVATLGGTIQVKDYKLFKITINKNDGNGKVLNGAKFAIYKNANCTGTAISTKPSTNGKVEFTNLVSGTTYSVKEVSAPAGYYFDNTKTKECTTVSSIAKDTTLTYTNNPYNCEKQGDKYYVDGKEITEDEYYNKCKPECGQDEDGQYYDDHHKPVSKEDYEKACVHICTFENGKYYDSKGNEVDETAYQNDPDCHKKCSIEDGKYYGIDGKLTTEENYNNECNPKCTFKDGKYYDSKGKEVTEADYWKDKACHNPCVIEDGKYFDSTTNLVSEKEYRKQCLPHCERVEGIFYDKNGNKISEREFNELCNPKCKKVKGKYYDSTGKEVDKATYKARCTVPKVKTPDTASPAAIASIAIGSLLVIGSLGFILRANTVKPKDKK